LPLDLRPEGSALWDDLAGNPDFALRPDEYRILAAACRQADVVAALEAAFAAEPSYLVRGSQGQPTVNGLITEARLGRAELSRLLKALGVPDDEARAQQRAQESAKRMSELGKISWAKRSGKIA
jgi:hypothetical protein